MPQALALCLGSAWQGLQVQPQALDDALRGAPRTRAHQPVESEQKRLDPALGEIDLIAADGEGRIVFVEVKTRRNEDHAQARLAVDHRKRTRMARAANHFIKTYNVRNKPLRFDVVTVILNTKGPATIRHYENVFVPGRF